MLNCQSSELDSNLTSRHICKFDVTSQVRQRYALQVKFHLKGAGK